MRRILAQVVDHRLRERQRARVRAEHRDGNVRPIAGQRIARGFGQRLQLVQLVLARAQRAVDERTQVGRQAEQRLGQIDDAGLLRALGQLFGLVVEELDLRGIPGPAKSSAFPAQGQDAHAQFRIDVGCGWSGFGHSWPVRVSRVSAGS